MGNIKVSAVSYLNTKPFLLGLEMSGLINEIDLSLEIPSKTAEKLLRKEVDLGLVPVGILPRLNGQYQIISDYCIGADGDVATVSLFSEVPLEEIEYVLLDHHSCTSIRLVQVLFKEYWKKSPQFISAEEGYINQIKGTTAGVVIGDRAARLKGKLAFEYDLAGEWKKFTALPFTFAAWVSTSPIETGFVNRLNAAFALGMQHVSSIVGEYQKKFPSDFDVHRYLTHYIKYDFGEGNQKALQLFLKYIESIELTYVTY